MKNGSTVCVAIGSTRVIGFGYPDDEGKLHHRTVEPYVHGMTLQDEEALYGYQVAGVSESLETLPGWRVFLLEKMKDIRVLDRVFSGQATGREHADHYIASIHCGVSGTDVK